MAYPTKDGNWISATKVTRIDCTTCGTVTTTRYPTNESETLALLREHAQKHGGHAV